MAKPVPSGRGKASNIAEIVNITSFELPSHDYATSKSQYEK